MNSQFKQKIKQFLKYGIALLMILVFFALYYVFNVTPYSLKTETIQISKEKTSDQKTAGEDLRIVLFSDLHLKKDYPASMLEKVVDEINAANSDLVIFAGDLYDNYDLYHEDEKVVEQLSRIQSRYGKLAIRGNRDYGGGAENPYLKILDDSGFTLLQNSNWYIPLDSGKTILFTGLDDALLGNPVLPKETKVYDSDYNIMLLHEPDEYVKYQNQGYDLALAGHSHGGQIVFPGDMILLKDFGSKYRKGLYDFENSKLFVTSGIGTTHISARLNVRPVISILDLKI